MTTVDTSNGVVTEKEVESTKWTCEKCNKTMKIGSKWAHQNYTHGDGRRRVKKRKLDKEVDEEKKEEEKRETSPAKETPKKDKEKEKERMYSITHERKNSTSN